MPATARMAEKWVPAFAGMTSPFEESSVPSVPLWLKPYARWLVGNRPSLYLGRRMSSFIGTGVPSHSAFLLWSS